MRTPSSIAAAGLAGPGCGAVHDEEIAAGLAGLDLDAAFTADPGELFRGRGRLGHGREVRRELIDAPPPFAGRGELVGPARAAAGPAETAWLARILAGLAGIGRTGVERFGGRELFADPPAPEVAADGARAEAGSTSSRASSSPRARSGTGNRPLLPRRPGVRP